MLYVVVRPAYIHVCRSQVHRSARPSCTYHIVGLEAPRLDRLMVPTPHHVHCCIRDDVREHPFTMLSIVLGFAESLADA